MKNILVTGGAGFVGTHLCKLLLEQGHYVTSVDNYYSSTDRIIKKMKDLYPNLSVMTHDVIYPFDHHHSIQRYDQIYNLACPASPPIYQRNHLYTMNVSVKGMENVLELANMNRSRVLQASTSEVYGDPVVHPQPETYWGNVNSYGERSCYDEGKRLAETMLYCHAKENKTDVRVARIFNTYGPHMNPDDGRVVSNFIVQALKGQDITIYGTGQQTRSFCFVSDLVRGLEALMNSSYTNPVNLGRPTEFTMLELAELVLTKTRSKSKIVFKDLPADDPQQRKPDISVAKAQLNWQPTVNLNDGLDETVSYFKGVLNV